MIDRPPDVRQEGQGGRSSGLSSIQTPRFVQSVGMEELAVSQARDHLGEAVNQVQYGREMVYLTRHGRRVAALVPVEVLEAIEAAEDAEDVAEAASALAEPGPDFPLAEIRAALGIPPRTR